MDGAVPTDAHAGHEMALAALSRRVGELEHRLDVMKIIVGLVLAAKVLIVVFFIYIVFGIGLARSGGTTRSPTRAADRLAIGTCT